MGRLFPCGTPEQPLCVCGRGGAAVTPSDFQSQLMCALGFSSWKNRLVVFLTIKVKKENTSNRKNESFYLGTCLEKLEWFLFLKLAPVHFTSGLSLKMMVTLLVIRTA